MGYRKRDCGTDLEFPGGTGGRSDTVTMTPTRPVRRAGSETERGTDLWGGVGSE